MKKIYLILLLCVYCLIPSCGMNEAAKINNDTITNDTTTIEESIVTASNGKQFEVIVIDSCEYLYSMNNRHSYGYAYQSQALSHKGNCKFCEERRKKKE